MAPCMNAGRTAGGLRGRIGALAVITLLALPLAGGLTGCGTTSGPDQTAGWSADKLYAEAKEEISSGNWQPAIKLLEKLESRYPFGRWSQQAQLDTAYAYYKDSDPANALATLDRFVRLHPNHERMDYVLYLRGLVNFNENQGLFAKLGGQDLSERDLKAARDAFDSFKQVVTRFPESRYAEDARLRMAYLVNAMAAGEVHIARYYFRRGAHVAAVNRAKNVVQQYQQVPAVEEALYILVRSYEAMGLPELRDDARRVLQTNFPDSTFLARGFAARDRSWWQFWR